MQQCIAPELIVLRVSRGRAWRAETAVGTTLPLSGYYNGSSGSGPAVTEGNGAKDSSRVYSAGFRSNGSTTRAAGQSEYDLSLVNLRGKTDTQSERGSSKGGSEYIRYDH